MMFAVVGYWSMFKRLVASTCPAPKNGGSFSCVPDGIATEPKIPLSDLVWHGFFGDDATLAR